MTGNILRWFRYKDICMEDNTALYAACRKAKEANAHLIGLYLFAPKDMDWHGNSSARSDLIFHPL